MKVLRSSTTPERDHAVVIGGSMAGMLAARVLAEHFTSVTLLERDEYPEAIEHRKGVPQSHHLHALLAGGLKIIEELFPGAYQELVNAGAIELDAGSDLAWFTPSGWGKNFHSDLKFLAFTRPFLDWHIRRRLKRIKNVEIVAGYEVTGLIPNTKRNGVSGVSVRSKNESAIGPGWESITADLVVDASGRHSHAARWLEAIGYTPPRETNVNAFLGYASRSYHRPELNNGSRKAIFLQAAPPEQARMGILFPVENNSWTLTLAGGGKDYPSSDEKQFLEFAESLRDPMIANAIRDAEPSTPIRIFRNMENRMRHYEKMTRFPGHFVLLGDSVCAFNPVYGQGMTVAAMGAIELGRSLEAAGRRELGSSFTRKFQKKLAKINALPWALATGEDCFYRVTEGATLTLKGRLMHAYLHQVGILNTYDTDVRRVWLRVFMMFDPPTNLFQPSIFFKVLRQVLASFKVAKEPRALATADSTG